MKNSRRSRCIQEDWQLSNRIDMKRHQIIYGYNHPRNLTSRVTWMSEMNTTPECLL